MHIADLCTALLAKAFFFFFERAKAFYLYTYSLKGFACVFLYQSQIFCLILIRYSSHKYHDILMSSS